MFYTCWRDKASLSKDNIFVDLWSFNKRSSIYVYRNLTTKKMIDKVPVTCSR